MSVPTANTPGYTIFRGRVTCDCMAAWLPVYEVELQRRGRLDGPLGIYQLTGSAAASGGTHGEGGAGDLIDLPGGDEEVWVARQMGADATWARKYNWDGKGGMAHLHCVLRGCPHNGPARYQIDAVDDGFNGLGRGGRGGVDTGPRPLSGRTWREGIAWARRLQEEIDDMNKQQEQKLDDLAEDVGKMAGDLKVIKSSLKAFRTSERVSDLKVFRELADQGKSDAEILAALEKLEARP